MPTVSTKATIKDLAPSELRERAKTVLDAIDSDQTSHERSHALHVELEQITKEYKQQPGADLPG